MNLKQARVENYKIVEDSTLFAVDEVTCLVGKNESGKSALLEALYKLNPVDKEDKDFTELDFPRRRASIAEADGTLTKANVVTTVWELDQEDVKLVTAAFGVNPLKTNALTVTKGYDNSTYWSISVDEAKLCAKYLADSTLNEAELLAAKSCATIEALIANLEGLSPATETQSALLTRLKTDFKRGTASKGIVDAIHPRWPKFLYFTDYYRMPGRASLDEVKRLQQANTLRVEDKVFLAFLDLANATIDEFATAGTTEQLYMKLEAVSNRITDEIFEFWTQNLQLEVEFKFDDGRPQDPSPYNSGKVFSTRIKNTRHRASVNFNERSTGFVWFFSFLVWFSQVKKVYGENLVILLDEPGLALHARAQGDLLRYINERLRPHHQVLFTTHSPFMVDPENLLSVRTVEDKVSIGSSGREVIEGTKVGDNVLSTDSDTLMPLQGALGYDITQSLFVGPNTLLVEGPSDILYLKAMSSELARRKRNALSVRWTVSPAGGLDKVQSFVSLFSGKVKNIAVLTDMGNGDRGKVDRLRKSSLLTSGHVLSADQYVDQSEADVEDILGRANYIELIKQCYELKKAETLPPKRPETAPIRCVKEVEDHMRLQPAKPEFDHFEPSRFMIENLGTLKDSLPEFDAALDRFEQLFKDLNGLLP